jgi:hypothetical protein
MPAGMNTAASRFDGISAAKNKLWFTWVSLPHLAGGILYQRLGSFLLGFSAACLPRS